MKNLYCNKIKTIILITVFLIGTFCLGQSNRGGNYSLSNLGSATTGTSTNVSLAATCHGSNSYTAMSQFLNDGMDCECNDLMLNNPNIAQEFYFNYLQGTHGGLYYLIFNRCQNYNISAPGGVGWLHSNCVGSSYIARVTYQPYGFVPHNVTTYYTDIYNFTGLLSWHFYIDE